MRSPEVHEVDQDLTINMYDIDAQVSKHFWQPGATTDFDPKDATKEYREALGVLTAAKQALNQANEASRAAAALALEEAQNGFQSMLAER